MQKLLSIIFIFIITTLPVFSLELDLSVDEEIKKKYNTNKINEDVLPALPKNLAAPSKSNSTVPTSTPSYSSVEIPNVTKVDYKIGTKIPVWTKFQVKSNVKINDWLSKGSSVTFISTSPVYKKSITIPAGTVFKGIIENIHRPQLSGNGSLIEIKINSMYLNGLSIPIDAKITRANGKKIFLNNIKGERKYLSGVGKQVDKGENFYKKSRTLSSKLASNPIGLVISPIPTIIGWAGYAVCTVSSPITGLSEKGGSVSIPSGSIFEIKLLKNVDL
ncbi:hypothetical protein IJ579_05385 [bacterium]|nr:hypothetical protein [bacterium]